MTGVQTCALPISSWIRRRVNRESLEKYITDAEINFPTLCYDFNDEYEYAANIIGRAIDDFLLGEEDSFGYDDENYDEIFEVVKSMCLDWFSDRLLNAYRQTCSEK